MTINYQQPYTMPFSGYSPPFQMGSQPFPLPQFPTQPVVPPFPGTTQPPFIEQSYIENILRLNRGKIATVYMNFEGSQWGSKIFKGEILEAGRDHIILKDPTTGITYLLLMIYLSYVTFDEDIAYEYPFSGA